jgi:hypothetical protein
MRNAVEKHWIEEPENLNEQEATWIELGEREAKEELWLPPWKHALSDLGRAAWRCVFAPPRLVREVGAGQVALEEHEWKHHHQRNWNA